MQVKLEYIELGKDLDHAEILFQQYSNLIYKYIIQFVRINGIKIEINEYDDIFQEIALKLIKNGYIDSFDEKRSSIKTWLSIISKTSVIDYMRKRNKQFNEVNVDIYENELSFEHKSNDLDLPKGLLTERQEQVINMFFVDGFEAKEIAQRLQISSKTARSIKHQALERLRNHLGVATTDSSRRAS